MELIKLLEEELKYHKEALELSDQRIEAIRKENLKKLKEVINKEKELIVKIKEVEQKRIGEVAELGCETLREYIEIIEDGEKKKKISKIRTSFLEAIRHLKENNILSKKMIDDSNEILNSLMKNLTEEKEIGYNKDYQKSRIINKNILNKKI